MSRIGCNNPNFGRRHTDSAKEIMSLHQKGEKHYNWRGGISYEPYCLLFNNAFKERVRLFFRRRCVECGKLESENWMRWGSQFKLVKLHVHHVKYDKKTCCKEGEPVGDRKFVTLCFTCHPRTNHNRKHWEMRYQEVIALEYGGKCYLTEEEYCNLNRI